METTKNNFQPTNSASPIQRRARQYSLVIRLLFAHQGLNGRLTQVNRGARHLGLDIRLSDPMKLDRALTLAEPLALSCAVNAVLAQRIEGVVSYQIELPQALWESYTRADLPMLQAVGLAAQRRPVLFSLDPPHSLVAGTTGSGKSETVKSILLALIGSYKPGELGIILIDPHRDYTDFHNEAHLVMPVAHEPGDINNALAWVNQELAYRKAEDVKDGKALVIVIGEADSVLTGANWEAARNVAKQARKYHMHLIIETQKPTRTALPDILDMLLNRFIGQLSDAKVSANVTGHAGLFAHKLTGKGDFLHLAMPDIDRFQVAMATRLDFDRLERTEVKPVEVAPVDVVELPAELPTRAGGRPEFQPDNPEIMAWYFLHNPNKISRETARQMLNLTRTQHEAYRGFVLRFVAEYLRLKNQRTLGA